MGDRMKLRPGARDIAQAQLVWLIPGLSMRALLKQL